MKTPNLKKLRNQLGMTQCELAKACDMAQSTLCYYETRVKINVFYLDKIIDIAKKRGIDIDIKYFLNPEEEQPSNDSEIKILRKKMGLRQKELAKRLKISKQWLWHNECVKATEKILRKVKRLASEMN